MKSPTSETSKNVNIVIQEEPNELKENSSKLEQIDLESGTKSIIIPNNSNEEQPGRYGSFILGNCTIS
jgi:hypothetical protein